MSKGGGELSTGITVVGGGAIGGTLAMQLASAGQTVAIVDADQAHVAHIRAHGLIVSTPTSSRTIFLPAYLPDDYPDGLLTRVLLCTKAHQTRTALEWIAPRLTSNGWVASMQNGLNVWPIQNRIGSARTVAGFVNLFADVTDVGRICSDGPGSLVLGELDGSMTTRVVELVDLLKPLGATASPHVIGYVWSKLAYGAILIATALTNATMEECLMSSYQQTLAALGQEVVCVGRQMVGELHGFDGWDPNAIMDATQVPLMFAAMADFLRHKAKVRSGVWRDLAVRHRPTEVFAQYGPVIALAEIMGIPVPRLSRLVQTINDVERGVCTQGWETLEMIG